MGRQLLGYGRRPWLALGLRRERDSQRERLSLSLPAIRCCLPAWWLLLLWLPSAHLQLGSDWCSAPSQLPTLPRCSEDVARFVVPARSIVASGGLGGALLRAGEVATVDVSTRDNFGEPFFSSGFTVCASFFTPDRSNPSLYAPVLSSDHTVDDLGDGNFRIRWVPTVAGVYHATVRLVHGLTDGPVASCDVEPAATPGLLPRTLVGGQPYYTMTVGSGPTVRHTIAVHRGALAHDFFAGKAVAGVPSTLQVTTSDQYGNRQTGDIDESHLFNLELSTSVRRFTGSWATVEGRRVFRGQPYWVMEERSAEESEWSFRAVAGEPGVYVGEFRTPQMEVCLTPIDYIDPNAPDVCAKEPGTVLVPVRLGVLFNDTGVLWPVADSPFAGSVSVVPPAQYAAEVNDVSRMDSKVSGPVVASAAGENVTIDVTLNTQWGQLIAWRLAFGALLSTVELEPFAPDVTCDGYRFVV